MDLQELHRRTEIPKRKLRYVLDHRLVPGLSIETARHEAGWSRRFAEDAGFGIVCAAYLLDLGLRHRRIREFLGWLIQVTVSGVSNGKLALVAILERDFPARAYLGVTGEVRLIVNFAEREEAPVKRREVRPPEEQWDTGWLLPADGMQPSEAPEPIACIELDLGAIRDQIFSARS